MMAEITTEKLNLILRLKQSLTSVLLFLIHLLITHLLNYLVEIRNNPSISLELFRAFICEI